MKDWLRKIAQFYEKPQPASTIVVASNFNGIGLTLSLIHDQLTGVTSYCQPCRDT